MVYEVWSLVYNNSICFQSIPLPQKKLRIPTSFSPFGPQPPSLMHPLLVSGFHCLGAFPIMESHTMWPSV